MAIANHDGERLSIAELATLFNDHFPQIQEGNGRITVEFLAPMIAHVRMAYDPRSIRPGGTVSGPAMFKLADFAVYTAILGERGKAAIEAVTTSMTINFLSRPEPRDMIAKARLLKLGHRLAVAEVEIYSEGEEEMVAHATATYSMPLLQNTGG
jgi:uncharacterized protein (TIGR00369 family)